MKLVSNTASKSVLVYFPEVDNPMGWTLENPAIYNAVCDEFGRARFSPSGVFIPSYLLFMASGKTEYGIHVSRGIVDIVAYDYLDYDGDSATDGLDDGMLFRGRANGEENVPLSFRTEGPAFILARMQWSNWMYYDPSQVAYLTILPRPSAFENESHWVRDWTNRIKGTDWDRNGKTGASNSLSELGRA